MLKKNVKKLNIYKTKYRQLENIIVKKVGKKLLNKRLVDGRTK